MSTLAQRLRAVDVAFTKAGLPHAFGGALALAYCTEEPRGTRDLDVNVFVRVDRADEVLDSLPSGASVSSADRRAARTEGQVRVMWGETPIDIFLDTHDFHREVAGEIANVPFEDTTIPVLSCHALVVFKAMFNRTRDWADIEAIIDAKTVDGRRALRSLERLVGDSDPKVERLRELLAASR